MTQDTDPSLTARLIGQVNRTFQIPVSASLLKRLVELEAHLDWLLENAPRRYESPARQEARTRALEGEDDLSRQLGQLLDPVAGVLGDRGTTEAFLVPWLQLSSQSYDVLALPWEIAAAGPPERRTEKHLGQIAAIVRVPTSAIPRPPVVMPQSIRLRTVAPRPRLAPRVDWVSTQAAVVAASAESDVIEVRVARPRTFEEYQVADGQHVAVAHFDGHGLRGAEGFQLLFEDESGGPRLVPIEMFLSSRVASDAQIVAINACFSSAREGGGRRLFEHVQRGSGIVLGMRTGVSADVAAQLMNRLVPDIQSFETPWVAIARARWHVANRFGRRMAAMVLAFGPPVDDRDARGVATVVDNYPAARSPLSLPSVLRWGEDLRRFDDFVHSGIKTAVLSGPVLAGKSQFLGLYRRYHDATCTSPQDLPPIAESTHLVASAANEYRLQKPDLRVSADPAFAAIHMELRGESEQEQWGVSPLWAEAITLAGSHYGSLVALNDLAKTIGLGAAVDNFRWSPSPQLGQITNRIRQEFEKLTMDTRRDAEMFGLLEGSFPVSILRTLYEVEDEEVRGLLGARYPSIDWMLVADQLCEIGLAQSEPLQGVYEFPAVVSAFLRARLVERVGDDRYMRLMIATSSVVHEYARLARQPIYDDADLQAIALAGEHRRSYFDALSSLIGRSVCYCIREGRPDISVSILRWAYSFISNANSPQFGIILTMLEQGIASAKRAGAATDVAYIWLLILHGFGLEARSQWNTLRGLGERICSVSHLGSEEWGFGRYFLVRALLNLRDFDRGRELLEEVERSCADEQILLLLRVVRGDLEFFQHGVVGTEFGGDTIGDARILEDRGDLAGALALNVRASVEARAAGDQSSLARALQAVGRLKGLLGIASTHELEEALELNSALGVPVHRTYYYLGMQYELQDDLDRAESAMLVSWRLDNSPSFRADVAYEWGIILMKSLQLSDEPLVSTRSRNWRRSVAMFRLSRIIYEETGNLSYAVHSTIHEAMLRVVVGQSDKARTLVAHAYSLGDAFALEQFAPSLEFIRERLR